MSQTGRQAYRETESKGERGRVRDRGVGRGENYRGSYSLFLGKPKLGGQDAVKPYQPRLLQTCLPFLCGFIHKVVAAKFCSWKLALGNSKSFTAAILELRH